MPELPYSELSTWLLVTTTVISMALLIKGADLTVEGAAGLASRFRISEIIIGATIVSLGTTAPEATVSVVAAWKGNPGLALGNAVGSVIADTGLIFGLGCLMVALPADRYVLRRQGWVQFASAMLLACVCYITFDANGDAAQITRAMGILFLALLAIYMFISLRWSQKHTSRHTLDSSVISQQKNKKISGVTLSATLAIGLIIIIIASHILIGSGIVIAERIGVPEVVIAATFVAFGTSLPELATAIASLTKGRRELLVGNVIGADILNILFVIGASATVAPLPIIDQAASIPAIFLYLHLPTMVLMLISFRILIAIASRSGSFSRWMGVPLLVIYAGYLITQYILFID